MKKTLILILMIFASLTSLFAAEASKTLNGKNTHTVYEPADGRITLQSGAFIANSSTAVGNALTSATKVEFTTVDEFNASHHPGIKDGGWADTTEKYLYVCYQQGAGDNGVYYISYSSDVTFVFPSDCSGMFGGFNALQTITLPHSVDTSNVTIMDNMFSGVKNLTTLDMSNWDLSSVTSMAGMLSGCTSLNFVAFPEGANAIGYDNSSEGLNMSGMFQNCSSLVSINLADVPIDGNTNMTNTFKGCTSLTLVVVNGDYNPADPPKGGTTIFEGCSSLPNAGTSTSTNGTKEGGCFTFSETSCEFLASLILDGTLNVYFDVKFSGFTPKSAAFTYPNYLSNSAEPVEATFNETQLKAMEKNGGYRFPANIAAAQMVKVLTIGLTSQKNNSFEPSTENITPKYIVNEVIKANSGDAKLVALCNSLLTYGSFAQLYFGVDTDNLAMENPTVNTSIIGLPSATYKYDGVAISGISDIAAATSNPEGLNARFLGNSLVCYSSMTTRHSFEVGEGKSLANDFTVSVVGSDGTDYVQEGRVKINPTSLPEREYIQIDGFSADKLGDTYTVTVTNKTTGHSFSITYSPLCYINGVLHTSAPTDPTEAESLQNLKNLCASLYWFFNKAQAYF